MNKKFELPDIIPVFPLPGALLLPRARLPLHIFEPRYLAMIDDVLKTSDRLLGMIQPSEYDGKERLSAIGCAGKLTQFSETEDGRYMITITGVSRYRIGDEIEGFHPYRKFKADWNGFDQDHGATEKDPKLDRNGFFDLLSKYLKRRGLSTDWESLRDADDELLINALSMMLDFEIEEKQALLEAPSLITRRETLVTLLEYNLRGGANEETLQLAKFMWKKVLTKSLPRRCLRRSFAQLRTPC